jgi:spore coat protein A
MGKVLLVLLVLVSASAFGAAYAAEEYKDPLPIPPRIVVPAAPEAELVIPMSQFTTQFAQGLPETTVWGYGGVSPGPTIEVESGTNLTVHWVNLLPRQHFLHVRPPGMHGMPGMPGPDLPDVRTVVHLHGAVVSQPGISDKTHDNDGWPDLWIQPGEQQIAEYPNQQTARTLWYHDHAMQTTGRNVYAGLAGMYLIHDAYERSLNLPSGDYEIPLIFQSKGFNGDGSLYYPSVTGQDYYGTVVTVNGKMFPYLNVEPRKYRFRILNASNSRTLAIRLINPADDSHGPAFYVIGTDSGFLEKTAVLNDPANTQARRLNLAPAERADVIIDFSKYAGKTFLLHNNSFTDEDDGEIPIPHIMQFRVADKATSTDTSQIPMQMKPIERLKPESAAQTRQIVIGDETAPDGTLMLMLNKMFWDDPITEFPVLGTTEVWQIINTEPDNHPFHIHLVQFQILDRTAYDVEHYKDTGQITLTGPAIPPPPEEAGWKDVVLARPGTITRIIMRFEPYAGYYVYHCHILEHEDMDMMRPFQVLGRPVNALR